MTAEITPQWHSEDDAEAATYVIAVSVPTPGSSRTRGDWDAVVRELAAHNRRRGTER